jgi:predicted PurR-regulated permease PerM
MENNQEQVPVQPPVTAQAPVGVNSVGTSGVDGPNGPFPAELNHWNWGAFLLSWIWAIGNHVWIGLLVLLSFIPVIGGIIALVMVIMLGIKGNEWAWKAKKWDSVEHFKTVQKKWAKWGVILLIVGIVVGILVAVAVIALLAKVATEAPGMIQQFDANIPQQ